MIYVGIILFLLLVGDLTLQYYNKWKIKKLSINIKECLEKSGFPLIPITSNNKSMYFLADTGCDVSTLDSKYLDQLDVELLDEKGKMFGIEGNAAEVGYCKFKFAYKEYPMTGKFQTQLLDSLNFFYEQAGIIVVGILGSDFFKRHGFIINYDDLIIYPSPKKLKK